MHWTFQHSLNMLMTFILPKAGLIIAISHLATSGLYMLLLTSKHDDSCIFVHEDFIGNVRVTPRRLKKKKAHKA